MSTTSKGNKQDMSQMCAVGVVFKLETVPVSAQFYMNSYYVRP